MITLKNYFFYIILFSFTLFSCKKENDTQIPDYFAPLIGDWEVKQGMPGVKYLEFSSNMYCSKLKQFSFELKSKEITVYQATKGQVILNSGYYLTLYNFSFSKDTLHLINPNEDIVAVKVLNAPKAEDWTGTITITKSFDAPIGELTDIGFDGTNLWSGNGYATDYLYKINPSNGNIDSIPTTQSAWAVEFATPYLWVSSDGGSQIYSVNKLNGADVSSSSNILGPWIYGIAWDGQYFWCYSGNDQTLRKYDPVGDFVVTEITMDQQTNITGLAYTNNSLYMVIDGNLAKCSVAPFKALNTYELKGYSIRGVAFDGTNFWLSAKELATNQFKILKVDF